MYVTVGRSSRGSICATALCHVTGDRWRPCVFPLRILQLAATFAVHHMWEAYNANPCRPPAKFEGKKDRRLGIWGNRWNMGDPHRRMSWGAAAPWVGQNNFFRENRAIFPAACLTNIDDKKQCKNNVNVNISSSAIFHNRCNQAFVYRPF